MRRWVVRAHKTKETGIAISAAERSDSDSAEETLLHGAAPMRSIYLGTTTMWTELFQVRLHLLHHVHPLTIRFRMCLKQATYLNYALPGPTWCGKTPTGLIPGPVSEAAR